MDVARGASLGEIVGRGGAVGPKDRSLWTEAYGSVEAVEDFDCGFPLADCGEVVADRAGCYRDAVDGGEVVFVDGEAVEDGAEEAALAGSCERGDAVQRAVDTVNDGRGLAAVAKGRCLPEELETGFVVQRLEHVGSGHCVEGVFLVG